jgi:hypothetical protein
MFISYVALHQAHTFAVFTQCVEMSPTKVVDDDHVMATRKKLPHNRHADEPATASH